MWFGSFLLNAVQCSVVLSCSALYGAFLVQYLRIKLQVSFVELKKRRFPIVKLKLKKAIPNQRFFNSQKTNFKLNPHGFNSMKPSFVDKKRRFKSIYYLKKNDFPVRRRHQSSSVFTGKKTHWI